MVARVHGWLLGVAKWVARVLGVVARAVARAPRLVARVLGVVARAVARVPRLVAKVFAMQLLGYLVWLLGCCYAVARVLVVVAMVSGGGC